MQKNYLTQLIILKKNTSFYKKSKNDFKSIFYKNLKNQKSPSFFQQTK